MPKRKRSEKAKETEEKILQTSKHKGKKTVASNSETLSAKNYKTEVQDKNKDKDSDKEQKKSNKKVNLNEDGKECQFCCPGLIQVRKATNSPKAKGLNMMLVKAGLTTKKAQEDHMKKYVVYTLFIFYLG